MLVAHAGLALDGSRRNFVVVDEVGHLPSGLVQWRTGDFRPYCVNPPLPRMLAALPMLAAGAKMPGEAREPSPGERPEWLLGLAFAEANKDRYLTLARLARLPGIVWSLWGAWLIGKWARELFGSAAGCLATALWCFDPTVIAFAQAVTPDVPASVAGLTAMYVFWRYLREPTWRLAAFAGLVLGIAELTKFTLLVLYAIIAWPLAVSLVRKAMRRERKAGTSSTSTTGAHFALMVAISLVVLPAGYGFQGMGRPLGELDLFSRALSQPRELLRRWPGTGLLTENLPLPLPRDYVQGIDLQYRDFEAGFPSYLFGEWRHRGWWYYYLVALAVKVPIGTLALLLWGVGRWLLRPETVPEEAGLCLVLTPFLILFLVSAQTGFNHHMRYVLPALPFLFVLAGGPLASVGRLRSLVRVLVALLLGATALSSVRVHPHQLSYFNEAIGGPAHGDRVLVDSNIDWGQDLSHLKQWIDERPEEGPISLAFYHILDPKTFGIDYVLPPVGPSGTFRDDVAYQSTLGPRSGTFAVSVNHLRGSVFPAPDGRGGYHWSGRGHFEYFQKFQPIARAGHSINIYRIDAEEAEAVRRSMGLPPALDSP